LYLVDYIKYTSSDAQFHECLKKTILGGCKTLSHALRRQYDLTVLENCVLTSASEAKREK